MAGDVFYRLIAGARDARRRAGLGFDIRIAA